MDDYCHNSGHGIDDIANQVGMRMDLHILGFNLGEFCMVVKSGRAVIHVLQAGRSDHNELIPLYHNSPFDTDGLAIPFLYSRFAWSIFYEGFIRLRSSQQFRIAVEGVSQSVKSYRRRLEEDEKMKEQDDERHEWNILSEDKRPEDEVDVSEELEEQPTRTVTADDEARWKERFPFFCEPFSYNYFTDC
jgi:hypothetical protein